MVAIFFEKFEMTFIDNREFERVSARISGAFSLKLCACEGWEQLCFIQVATVIQSQIQ